MSTWFSNRGQMIQVGCAVVGAAVALFIFFSIRPEQLLSGLHELGPKLLVAGVGAATGLLAAFLARSLRSGLSTSAAPTTSFGTGSHTATINVPPPPPPKVAYGVAKGTMTIGARKEFTLLGRDFSVVLHDVSPSHGEIKRPSCDIEFVRASYFLHPTNGAQRTTGLRFTLPATTNIHFSMDTHLLVSFEGSGDAPMACAFYVEHINVHAKEISYVCYVIR